MHNELDYNYIDDGIYIGTNQCCQSHFEEDLLKKNVEADISLEEDKLDAPFGINFYVWIPVKNHTAPRKDQFEFGISVLEKLVSMGKKVYVHCQNGHGRAPTLVAAYFMKSHGLSVKEAENLIKSKRPNMHLKEVQRQALTGLKI